MAIYRGLGGVNREIKQQFRGLGGVNREIKEEYRGLSGVNRKVFSSDILNTTFDVKNPNWVESGGTFNYGNGLYSNIAEAKGTLDATYNGLTTYDVYVMKYITIPLGSLSLSTFTLHTDTTITTSVASQLGGIAILLCNGNTPILSLYHADDWAASQNQSCLLYKGRAKDGIKLYDSGILTGYSGRLITHKIVCNNGSLIYYVNGSQKATSTLTVPTTIDNIKILFLSYRTSYDSPARKISFLQFFDEIV